MTIEQTAQGSLTPVTEVKPAMVKQRITIRASSGWGNLGLGDVWRYRELLWFLSLREIKASHRQTALGPLWFIVRPLVNMVIFSLVFGRIAKLPSNGIPYPLFTYSALLPWTYFATAATMAVGSLVSRMDIISKVYFPRLIVPISGVIAALMDLLMSMIILAVMMIYYHFPVTWYVITLPLFVLFAALVALAVGLWGATLAVRYRDVLLGVGFVMTAWMYLTPVAYSASLISARWLWLYELNPMFWIVEGFRWALLGSGTPPQPYMLIPLGATLFFVLTGAFVFRRTERTIVDLL